MKDWLESTETEVVKFGLSTLGVCRIRRSVQRIASILRDAKDSDVLCRPASVGLGEMALIRQSMSFSDTQSRMRKRRDLYTVQRGCPRINLS